jgi:hypothetical protein
MVGQKCHSCSTTETPEWRRGPDGARTLCNACGLRKYNLVTLSFCFFILTVSCLDYSKLLKRGSIGVQTKNYLLAAGGGTSRASSSSPSARHQLALTNQPAINYPFVLMGPKYGTYVRQKSHLIQGPQPTSSGNSTTSTTSISHLSTQPYYTQQLPPISTTLGDSPTFVNTTTTAANIHNSNIDNNTMPFPSLSINNESNRAQPPPPPSSSSDNSITTLRIHQWKQNQ